MSRVCSAILLVCLCLGSCHDEINPLRYLRHERATVRLGKTCCNSWTVVKCVFSPLAEKNILFHATPHTLSKSGEWVTIEWSGVDQPTNDDWVGVWVLPSVDLDIDTKTQAPVKYQVS